MNINCSIEINDSDKEDIIRSLFEWYWSHSIGMEGITIKADRKIIDLNKYKDDYIKSTVSIKD